MYRNALLIYRSSKTKGTSVNCERGFTGQTVIQLYVNCTAHFKERALKTRFNGQTMIPQSAENYVHYIALYKVKQRACCETVFPSQAL